jgi:NAD(P)-dependent dehydrogenase (short-subunit alcohol dehydrogenase family)
MENKKTILILGSQGGLGSRISQYLIENFESNFQVLMLSRNALQTQGFSIPNTFDALDHVDNQRMFASIEAKYGPIWAVIDATGLSISNKYIKSPWESITQQIEVNLLHPLNVCSYFLKSMTQRNQGGRLIFFSSVLVSHHVIGTSAYTISKTALEKVVQSISKEIFSDNLTLNCIRLGFFDFGMINQVKNPKNIGGNRLGVFQDIVPTLIDLLSDESNGTNGQVIEVVGGTT